MLLLVYIDDATGRLMLLRFCETESAFDYMLATREYLEKHGKPVAFYSDKHAVFRVSQAENRRTGTTQFGRVLHDLNIELICANSSQAKGRIHVSPVRKSWSTPLLLMTAPLKLFLKTIPAISFSLNEKLTPSPKIPCISSPNDHVRILSLSFVNTPLKANALNRHAILNLESLSCPMYNISANACGICTSNCPESATCFSTVEIDSCK